MNTFTGLTTIGAGTTLALAGAGSAANSVGVTDNGTLDVSQAANPMIQSLSGSGSLTLGTTQLTLSQASGSFGGVIGGGGGLTVAAGTETLPGVNTFTGATYIDGGILSLGSSNALGSTSVVTFNGGTLQYSGSNTTDYSGIIKNSNGAISIDTNGQLLRLRQR